MEQIYYYIKKLYERNEFMKKIILLIKKLFKKVNSIFFVGASDILPEPLSKEDEKK